MVDYHWPRFSEPDQLEKYYQSLIPDIKAIGRNLGYAIAVHGSLRRDLDLIAVPWIDDCVGPTQLALAVWGVCGIQSSASSLRVTKKPHGRLAYYMPIGTHACIDLSVTPHQYELKEIV